MDAKDLRTETTIGERNSNGSSKFAQVGAAPPCSVSKTYENHSANPLAKLEAPSSRPCAVIGPDRIVPPSTGDGYSKKGHYEPWLHVDNTYRQPPEYPHKIPSYQSPIRNISPRQTFQENMQRIMVQPSYNSVKLNDDSNYTLDRNATKNSKITGPHEAKYCDVPYSVNPISSDQKPNEMCVNNMNSTRNYPQVWHSGGVGIRPTRPYVAPELYQFSEYTNCAGPRPMPMPRPHRTMNEDPSHAYNETYYPEGNIRFKPYPTVKDRYQQARYEYVSNYANPFHPPPFPSHKYDLQKPLPPHVTYPQIPIKYLENRMTDTIMDGYQRPQPVNYNVQYRNQVIHPTYGPMIGSNIQNKVYPYPLEGPVKSLASNKLPYDNKLYTEYENARNKGYPVSDNVYHMKNQPIHPNYPPSNMQPTHGHPYYRKESLAIRNYEYLSHLRHIDPSMNPNALTRLSTQFSPNSIAISPSDSNTSNETSHTHGGSLEDCGYVSQSSTTSIRSFDAGVNRMMPNDFYQRYNYPYQTMVRTSPLSSKLDVNGAAISSKDTKTIDVRQFLQTWNEGEEENSGKEKEVVKQSDFTSSKLANQYGTMKNHEQLYVLGLVNVPSEELGKYEHIQKISKLPENIKGYNNIELLKHFEEAIESSNINNPNHKQPMSRNYHSSLKSSSIQGTGLLPPRPISPLDVEAKISQSVIHKEVGCNFEIKPCSPEMLNAEVATTAQSIIGEERVIEKVSNPIIIKSPMLSSTSESEKICDAINRKEHRIMLKEDINKTPSCKMIHTQCSNNEGVNVSKSNYSLHDLESNAGVCLASLPRLDNDIELTFPEVNQQFINANKESVIIANDYTTEMEPMQNDDNYKAEENSISKSENTSSVMPMLDLEKEVSKLSKYRKIKRNDAEFKDNQFLLVSQSLRTDSVIIKNPENTKSSEKKSRIPPLVKETNQTLNNNLTNPDLDCDSPVSKPTTDNINMHEDSNEMAIDFSLSRVEDKHSKYFCEMYSTKNLNSPPATLDNDQQFLEDTNTACNLQSDSTNDITIKIPNSDEVNDINLCPVSDNIKNYNALDFGKLDITELNDVQHLNVVRENKMVAECSENEMNTIDHEFTKKCIKPTEEVEQMDTSPVHLGLEKVKGILHSDSLSAGRLSVYKVPDNNDRTTKIQNEENSSNVFNKKIQLKNNTTSSVESEFTVTELNCTNNVTTQSVVPGKPVLCKLVENKNCKIDLFVKQLSLKKELFSPQIQNLILWNEGQSGLISSLQNENKNTSVKELKENSAIVNNLHSFKDLNIGQNQLKFTNVKDHRIFDSEKDDIAVDNFTNYELQSVSTEVTAVDNSDKDNTYGELQLESTDAKNYADSNLDTEVNTADNNVKDCTYDELQSESTNVKDNADSDLNAEVSAVEKTDKDCTFDELQSESTNVKDNNNSNLDAEVSNADDMDYNVKNYTNVELQSDSTNVKDNADSILIAEVSVAKKTDKDCTNNKPLSESTNVKYYADSDLDAEVSVVNTSVNDCTTLQSESTYVSDYADSNLASEVSAVYKIDKDCSNNEIQSESTCVNDYANSDLDSEVSAVDKIVNDCTNTEIQSKSTNAKDYANSDLNTEVSAVDNSVKDCTYDELKSESTNVKEYADSDLDAKVSVVDNIVKDCTYDELKSESTNVKEYTDSDLDAEVSVVDNSVKDCTYNELKSESTNVKEYTDSDLDAEISVVDNSVKDCTYDELKSESTNNKEYTDSDLDAEVSVVDNSVKDCTYNELKSESTNVKEYTDSDLDAQISVVDNSVKDCTYDELKSESTNNKKYTDSDLDAEVSVVDNSVKDCIYDKLKSESSNVKDYADSDLDAKVTAVDNSDKDNTYGKLKSESSIVKDFADSDLNAEVSDVDNSVKDCTYHELISKSTNVKEYADTDLDAEVSAVDNSFKDFINDRLQSKSTNCKDYLDSSYAQDTTINKDIKDCVDNEMQKESFRVQDYPDSNLDAHVITVYNSVKDGSDEDELQLSSNGCAMADAEFFTKDNLNSFTHLTNNTLQPELTNFKDCSVSGSAAEVSNIDGPDSIENIDSQSDPDNFKDFPVANSNLNVSEDNSRSVTEFINCEIQLKSTDVKDSSILGAAVKISDVEILNSVNVGVNSKLCSDTIIVKSCEMTDTNVKLSVLDRLNIVEDGADSELESKTTEVNDCATSGSDVETSVVDRLNRDKDYTDSELQVRSTNSNDYPILDTYVKNSCMGSINSLKNITQNAVYSKAFNCKESSSDITDFEIKAGNINDETCFSNDVSLDDKVPYLSQNIDSDIKETKKINDVLSDVRPIAVDSSVHDMGQINNDFDEQATEKNNLILYDPNICRQNNSVEKLDQIKTLNEEIMMPSDTKPSLIRRSLKRSLSDSALCFYNDKSENFFQEDIQLHNLITTKRRRKNKEFLNTCEPHYSTNEMLNIHNIRRNSISSIYNEENMSFCIVIDNNCIITEENDEGEKLCYTEIPEECLSGIHTDNFDDDDRQPVSEIVLCPQENISEYDEPLVLKISHEKSLEESWVDDVACVETVVSDDIAEDIEVSAPSSPTEIDEHENDESGIFTSVSEHTEKVKYIYGDKMCNDDAELVETLYRTPQMDVNKTLINRESHATDDDDECFEEDPLNNISSESRGEKTFVQTSDNFNSSESKRIDCINKSTKIYDEPISFSGPEHVISHAENNKIETMSCEVSQDDTINSCESSVDDVFAYNQNENSFNCSIFSSPEVSSTTSEEKNTSLLLKITNYQGTRTSQLNDLNLKKTNSCKFTENINYTNFISNSTEPRPLITKAAQKYIPPLKETVDDLKVKLPLPQDSLMKFKQLKMAKTEVRHNAVPKKDIPKKPKPKFEDVLKSLDEIQFKMHKEKRKRSKKPVPKVVIKKTENGSHYASTSNRDCFNPDLTGRKWQPWVFIEKSSFIDKMALRRKTKAIYNHRKNTYVFADKFKKYKSMPSTKFVITQPKLDDTSMGKLKYTIRLKHSY